MGVTPAAAPLNSRSALTKGSDCEQGAEKDWANESAKNKLKINIDFLHENSVKKRNFLLPHCSFSTENLPAQAPSFSLDCEVIAEFCDVTAQNLLSRKEKKEKPRWTHESPGKSSRRGVSLSHGSTLWISLSFQSPEDASHIKVSSPFTLLPRADAIRSKLIYTFCLIDRLQGLSHAIPRHNVKDFLDPKKQRKVMLTDHHQLVRFNITPVRHTVITPEKRLRNRIQVRCSQWPPLTMWASWVLNSTIFKSFIICLIFLNMVVLMVESEVMGKTDANLLSLKLTLEVTVWVVLLIFIMEILLNWIVSFRGFWKSNWNIFDLSITMVSVIPEFLDFVGITNRMAAMRIIRAFRVLRTLKLFSRFRHVRVIILAIAKTLKAMNFILLLFLLFFYVFAVAGIFFFESYSRSDRTDLEYSMYFRDFHNTLVTLFILFTMDHWYALLQDIWQIPEMNKVISSLYIILWLLIGSFMFRNIFVAIMVTNFQTIRSDLTEEVKQIETQKKADLFKTQIRERSQDYSVELGPRAEAAPPAQQLEYKLVARQSVKDMDWETYIHQNLQSLVEADEDGQVVWPSDSLFRYFELLEQLQHNLEERKKLQHYAVMALLNLEDR
ncbi:cation channel sperm-associated protein 2 [Carettochelys insculpta]|uniref:cation channel sperm-associated protein 2 n=1 Tax=Carettochelys insculpta TaxID=44489 RepID=UPI003EB74218